MKRPTNDELVLALDRQDWSFLWLAGLPLTGTVLRVAARRGRIAPERLDEDAVQQTRLVIGENIKRWLPFESTFATWVVSASVGPLLNWLRVQSNRGIGSKNVRSETIELNAPQRHSPGPDEPDLEFEEIDTLAYPDPPEGYDDPALEAERAEMEEALRELAGGEIEGESVRTRQQRKARTLRRLQRRFGV